MNTESIKQLLRIFELEAVPLSLSIPFLLRIKGLTMQDIADRAGYSRDSVVLVMQKQREPTSALRSAFEDLLGVDPWDVSGEQAEQKTMCIESEIQ